MRPLGRSSRSPRQRPPGRRRAFLAVSEVGSDPETEKSGRIRGPKWIMRCRSSSGPIGTDLSCYLWGVSRTLAGYQVHPE